MAELTLEQRRIVIISCLAFAGFMVLLGICLIIYALCGSELRDWFERRIRAPLRRMFGPTLQDRIDERVANVQASGRNPDSGLPSLYEFNGQPLPESFIRIEAGAEMDPDTDPQPFFTIPSALERVLGEESQGVDVSELVVVHSVSGLNPRHGIPNALYASDRDNIAATLSLGPCHRPNNPVYAVRRIGDPDGQNPANAMVWYSGDSLNHVNVRGNPVWLMRGRLEVAMRNYLEGLFFNRNRSLTQSRQNGLLGNANDVATQRLYLPVPALRDFRGPGYENEYDVFALALVLLLEYVGNQPSVVVLNGCGIRDIEFCVPDNAARQRLDEAISRAYALQRPQIALRTRQMDRSRRGLGYFLLDPRLQEDQEADNPEAADPMDLDHLRRLRIRHLEAQQGEQGQEGESSGALAASDPSAVMEQKMLAWITEKGGQVSEEEAQQYVDTYIEQQMGKGLTDPQLLESVRTACLISLNLVLHKYEIEREGPQQREGESSSEEEEGRASLLEAELGASSADGNQEEQREDSPFLGGFVVDSVEGKDQEKSSHK